MDADKLTKIRLRVDMARGMGREPAYVADVTTLLRELDETAAKIASCHDLLDEAIAFMRGTPRDATSLELRVESAARKIEQLKQWGDDLTRQLQGRPDWNPRMGDK